MLGHLPDSGLVARKLADEPLCLVASPDYLHRAGTPQTLDALQGHACLPFILPRTGRIAPWELLPQLRGRSRPFSVVYAPHRRQSAATLAMIGILTGADGLRPAP